METGNAIFEGDVLLRLTNDGAEICIEDELICCDREFDTAVLLSLFGGNAEDDGTVEKRMGWWGNYTGEDGTKKMISRYQAATYGKALTTNSAKEALEAARLDLQWLIDEGVADDLEITGSIASVNRFDLSVTLLKNGAEIYKNTYALNWEMAQWHGKTKL